VLLALEIVASRVIAPYFGNSVYVWGSLIGVFLAALSAGYYLGGIVADRAPSTALFSGIIFVAGLLVFPVPLFAPRVLEAIVFADYGARGGPLVAALALFFLPSLVMGMVSPFAVRLRARTVTTIGNVAGVLYALSTLGSIAGTLLAAFVLLAYLGVRTIIHLLGVVMMLMALLGWLGTRRLRAAAGAAMISILLVTGTALVGPARSPSGQIFAQDTVYHRISVSDEAGVRYLRLDDYWQSGMDSADPRRTVFPYSDYMHLPLVLRPDAARVLFIGLGGGTVPKRYYEDYPRMDLEVVELDPAVVAVARRYFGVPDDARLRIAPLDGRLFVTRTSDRYDIMLLDAYLIDTIPFHLATREFFQTAKARLSPGGALASNVIGALAGPQSRLFRAVYKTLTDVFHTVYVFPVDWQRYNGRDAIRNIIIIGTDQPALSAAQFARAAARARAALPITVSGFARAAGDLYAEPIATSDVPVLTDDFAPVELLIQRGR
jgi:spermidine synthase